MALCVTWTTPTGTVVCTRPHPGLVEALQAPTLEMAVRQGEVWKFHPDLIAALRSNMTTRTEGAAVDAIAARDIAKVCGLRGWALPQDVSKELDTGLLADSKTLGLEDRRRFRASWRKVAGISVVDIPLARIQRMNEVRAARAPKLEQADKDEAIATRRNNTVRLAAIRLYKNSLCDIPQRQQAALDACTNPEALIAWEPTWPTNPA